MPQSRQTGNAVGVEEGIQPGREGGTSSYPQKGAHDCQQDGPRVSGGGVRLAGGGSGGRL